MNCETCYGRRIVDGLPCEECGLGQNDCCSGELALCSPEMRAVEEPSLFDEVSFLDELSEEAQRQWKNKLLKKSDFEWYWEIGQLLSQASDEEDQAKAAQIKLSTAAMIMNWCRAHSALNS